MSEREAQAALDGGLAEIVKFGEKHQFFLTEADMRTAFSHEWNFRWVRYNAQVQDSTF